MLSNATMENYSDTMTTELASNFSNLEKVNREQVMKQLPILVFYVVMLVVGVVGNTLVLVVYKVKLKRSSARIYIISLAMADLFVCVFGLPYHILDKLWIVNYTHEVICKGLTFMVVSGTFSSIFVLLVVGLDRFLKVCRPLKRQIKDFGNRKACLIAFVLAVVFALPHLVLYGERTYYRADDGIIETNCFIDDEYTGSIFATGYLGIYILIFIGSVIFLSIIYGFICRKIFEHDKMQGIVVLNERKGCCSCLSGEADGDDNDNDDDELNEDSDSTQHNNDIEMTNLTNGDGHVNHDDEDTTQSKLIKDIPEIEKRPVSKSKASSKRNPLKARLSTAMVRHTAGKKQASNTKKITLMMFTITVVFIIAYLPFIVINLLDNMVDGYWDDMSDFVELLNDFLMRLYLMNNVANPIIYCFWDKRFRKECVRLLRRYLCCQDVDDGHGKTAYSNNSSSSKDTQYTVAK